MEGLGHNGEPGFGAGTAAQRGQHPRFEQQAAVAFAGVKFGKNMQTVHSEEP
jgi:hypothetical protein